MITETQGTIVSMDANKRTLVFQRTIKHRSRKPKMRDYTFPEAANIADFQAGQKVTVRVSHHVLVGIKTRK